MVEIGLVLVSTIVIGSLQGSVQCARPAAQSVVWLESVLAVPIEALPARVLPRTLHVSPSPDDFRFALGWARGYGLGNR